MSFSTAIIAAWFPVEMVCSAISRKSVGRLCLLQKKNPNSLRLIFGFWLVGQLLSQLW